MTDRRFFCAGMLQRLATWLAVCLCAAGFLSSCSDGDAPPAPEKAEKQGSSRAVPSATKKQDTTPATPAASDTPDTERPEASPPELGAATARVTVSPGLPPAMPAALPSGSRASAAEGAFEEVTAQVGTEFRHQKGVFDAKLSNIMPWISSIGAAVAVADVDGDGDLDFYVTSSRRGTAGALFINQRLAPDATEQAPGPLRFVDGSRAAGLPMVNDAEGVSMDAAFGDLDNDGDPDLYIVQWGKNRLFRNDGTGKFEEISDEAGVDDRGNGNGVLYFDYDSDGDLDIFVCNYFPPVDLHDLKTTRIMHDSFEQARNGGANTLFRNDGNMKFTEVAHNLHLDDKGWSLDAGISDIDNDGDVDLYIANDFGPDRLFLNTGDGSFLDITERSVGFDNRKGMNVDFGDFNGDGFTDIYVSNITTAEYLKEGNMLWLNGGDRTFTDVGTTTRTADGGWGWCARFLDYDLDGNLDVITVNGFVSAGRETYWSSLAEVAVDPAFDPADSTQWPAMTNRSLSGYESTRLFRNNGDGSFAERAKIEGVGHKDDGRGIAAADFDADGDLDLVVVNQNQPLRFYRNRTAGEANWVSFRLQGTRSNRDAIGARVELAAGGKRLLREVNGVNGFSSQSDYAAHFGLGEHDVVERATIFWPSGVVSEWRDLPANRHYHVKETGEPRGREERLALYFSQLKEGRKVAQSHGSKSGAPDDARGAELLALEEELRLRPRNVGLGNRYRTLAKKLGYFERSIDFFRSQVAERVGTHVPAMLRLQLAVAFIDRIPSAHKDVILQASLAKESLAQLDVVLEAQPQSYWAHFIAGMNYLYWPAGLKQAPNSLRHLEYCWQTIASSAKDGIAEETAPFLDRAHRLQVRVAIGDAHAKDKNIEAAKRVWMDALKEHPDHEGLKVRVAKNLEQALEFLRTERSLNRPIDTSLPLMEGESELDSRELRLRAKPADHAALGAYRSEVAEIRAYSRAKRFLDVLRKDAPDAPEPVLHRALVSYDAARDGVVAGDDIAVEAAHALELLAEYQKRVPTDWRGSCLEAMARLWLILRDEGATPPDTAIAALLQVAERADRMCRRDGVRRIVVPGLALADSLWLAGRAADAKKVWHDLAQRFAGESVVGLRLQASAEAIPTLLQSRWLHRTKVFTDLDELIDIESELIKLEQNLAAGFQREVADRYRQLAKTAAHQERVLSLFRRLLESHGSSADLRVQLALALVDRTPDRNLGSVQKGLLSSEALDVLKPVMEAHPDSWGLQVLIGSIHANWFTKLGHVPEALMCFQRAMRIFEDKVVAPLGIPVGKGAKIPDGIAERLKSGPGASSSSGIYAQAYQGLGDMLVKNRQFPRARQLWRRGLKFFPGNPGLTERMDLTSVMVRDYVERRRSWAAIENTQEISATIGPLPELGR